MTSDSKISFTREEVISIFRYVVSKSLNTTFCEFNDDILQLKCRNDIASETDYLIQYPGDLIKVLTICDHTNNPPEKIDRNEFHVSVYLKFNQDAVCINGSWMNGIQKIETVLIAI